MKKSNIPFLKKKPFILPNPPCIWEKSEPPLFFPPKFQKLNPPPLPPPRPL